MPGRQRGGSWHRTAFQARMKAGSLNNSACMQREIPSANQKALQINLDTTKYGTFAEIGAGQEVARWFFRVGGAAGTIAKTISAYDMDVSDAIYDRVNATSAGSDCNR